ncbi:MAG: SDR family oxidoreductase [Acidobacteriia bacterium]|nr:SDR family oxidoreductase [Terriglobia bacterium]
MNKEPQPRVVMVTGASAGVGRAVVGEFAREGASIGLIARGQERLQAAAREVEQAGARALVLRADVADAEAVEGAAQKLEAQFGPIDVWVNNAMTTIFAPFHQITPEEFRRTTEVTYLGFVYGTMAAIQRMRQRDRGSIVQVGSALAYRSIPLQSAYCGAKHAIVGFTDSLRSELIHQKSRIHITVVHLPAMNTPQFSWCRSRLPDQPQPVPPIFQPEVAARAIVWASSHRRREIYVGWPTMKAIYGQKVVAGYADKYLAETGYSGQETQQPIPPDRPDNLFKPAPGDFSAHGIFDARASDSSPLTWVNLHRGVVAAGAAALAGVATLLVQSARAKNGVSA